MKYDIIYPTSLEQIDPVNDNIDILVQTENGKQYTFVVATPDNLKYLMNKDKISFLKPGLPFLFVEKLTHTNIDDVVQSLLEEDEQLIRIYGTDIY